MRVTILVSLLAASIYTGLCAQGSPPPAKPLFPFKTERELAGYFHQLSTERFKAWQEQQARRGCRSTIKTSRHKTRTVNTVITGRVTDAKKAPVQGARLDATEYAKSAVTDKNGRFRIPLPTEKLEKNRRVMFVARAIGYRALRDTLKVSPGDSIEARIGLCVDPIRLEEAVVTAAAEMGNNLSVTNTQHTGVDEGGIVKLHGKHLVILRRGRLFTVALGDSALRPIAAVDAFAPGLDPRGAWYDEMLVYGDKVIVIGYSYARGGTELGIFRIDQHGGLEYQDTYQLRSNDYYSSRNYASRLVGSRLVFYTPFFVGMNLEDDLAYLPAMRRWGPEKEKGRFERLVSPETVYRSAWKPAASEHVVLHSVTSCDLAARELRCEASGVIGGIGHVFYVSPTAVYVWTSQGGRGKQRMGPAALVRLPLDGSRPGALAVGGTPIDQFSFLEAGDGWLNVLVRAGGRGEWMWRAECSVGDLALLRFPLERFEDGTRAIHQAQYREVPRADGIFHNRFVGVHLLYGTGNGWGSASRDTASLVVVPLAGGPVTQLPLPHGADRIEVMGRDAVVMGARKEDLVFTGVALESRPELVQRFTLRGASQGELRSHGFFYRADGADEGVFGLPVSGPGREGWQHLFKGSAGVLFLENRDRRFYELGALEARADTLVKDQCQASCVDWYGNARPLFVRGRVFALMGYELVEGAVKDGRIQEIRRAGILR